VPGHLHLEHRRSPSTGGGHRDLGHQNQIAIIGGTGKYKTARGDATLTSKVQDGSIQRIKLRILR